MTVKQRQHLLSYLGYYVGSADGEWGAMSRAACTAFQKDFGGIAVDGTGGPETDKALKHAVAYDMFRVDAEEETAKESTGLFWDGIKYFTPDEVRCKCGGKYCDGFPYEMQPLVMQILDRAREWSGHPIVVISGLRCSQWNAIQGGVSNSQHMYGEAVDAYFYGKTPGAALAWLQSQPEVRYAYQIDGSNNIHFDIHPVGR